MLAATSCSDFSDYNSVPESSTASADKTLWQNIVSNENLSDFANLVQKTGYGSALNSPSYYTVMAPVNGSFDATVFNGADSIQALTQFVKQHIAEYGSVISGNTEMDVRSLNNKIHTLTSQTIDGVEILQMNLPSSNGVLHTLKGLLKWTPNVYENLEFVAECDSMVNYIKKYDLRTLDVNASVVGPTVNGKITYLDSVIVKSNKYFTESRVQADVEDSTYTMVVLNNNAWNAEIGKVRGCLNYVETLKFTDWSRYEANKQVSEIVATDSEQKLDYDYKELTDSMPQKQMMTNMVFSHGYKCNDGLIPGNTMSANDTLFNTERCHLTDGLNIINHTVGGAQVLTNGYTRVVDQYPFNSWETYNPILTYDNRTDVVYNSRSTVTRINLLNTTRHERDLYFEAIPAYIRKLIYDEDSRRSNITRIEATASSPTAQPGLCFKLDGVRSAKYHIYVVTFPSSFAGSNILDIEKKLKMNFTMDYADANDSHKDYSFGPKEVTDVNKKYQMIDLGEFTFPVSYYGTKAYPTLKMWNSGSNFSEGTYEQTLRIASVILVPVEAEEYYKN